MATSDEILAARLAEGLTFEKVWASLMELREFQRETAQQAKIRGEEIDRRMQENAQQAKIRGEEIDRRIQETDRILQENAQQMKMRGEEIDRRMQETDKQMKETDKRLGEFTNRFGKVVEHMVFPNLLAKFQELDFTVKRGSANVKITDEEHNIFTEIDAFLENGDQVIAVEIKTTPKMDDIDDHIERMEKLRRFADLRNDRRKYLGAIAGVVFADDVKHRVLKNGFFVIQPSGETFVITKPEHTPREW